jgi:hypothetical protein
MFEKHFPENPEAGGQQKYKRPHPPHAAGRFRWQK